MNPIPNFQTPLELFPLEIWEAIFESLTFKELTACYRATPTWNIALRDRSALFLFPEVFPVLTKKFSVNQLLFLRTVCKQWKETVDTFLTSTSRVLQEEELSSSANYWKPKNNDKISTIKKWLYKTYKFDSSQGIARFVQSVHSNFNGNESNNSFEILNPFISRQVSCIDKCLLGHEIHRQRLRSHISTLLTNFGKFIWYFTLSFEYERNCSIVYCYYLAQAYLSHLSNVKILFIQSRAEFENDEVNADAVNQQFEEATRRKPIVTLEHLETLKIDGLPPRIVKEILVKNCHIKKLDLGDQPSLFTGHLRNCLWSTELREIKEFKGSTLWAKVLTNDAIPERICWPLEKLNLSIQFNQDIERGEVRLETLFKLVSKFGETLRHLELNLWCLEGEEGSGLELQLPHLETIEIKADRFCFKSVDFLRSLSSLKKLDFSVKAYSLVENASDFNGAIEFNGYFDKMYESNIWDVLCNLEEVIIRENTIVSAAVVGSEEVAVTESEECFMYTREEYVSRVNAQR
ncbi:unnamed protein product [Orchesella dallaii]|uniref:F-box domain-containing protein n=1 Tax=Orchesella dallaii TaxID=48710 RepID=A0ABP1RLH8_9HEXA